MFVGLGDVAGEEHRLIAQLNTDGNMCGKRSAVQRRHNGGEAVRPHERKQCRPIVLAKVRRDIHGLAPKRVAGGHLAFGKTTLKPLHTLCG